jgi:predicted DNA-binding antitoxin AbrB/MazE fold protein
MTTNVEVVYQGGVFKPVGPVDLPENQRVRLQVDAAPNSEFQVWLKRVQPLQQAIVARFGILPDSTPIIAEDRRRNG